MLDAAFAKAIGALRLTKKERLMYLHPDISRKKENNFQNDRNELMSFWMLTKQRPSFVIHYDTFLRRKATFAFHHLVFFIFFSFSICP